MQVQTHLHAGVSVGRPGALQQLMFNLITNGLEALAGYRADGVLRIASAVVAGQVEICVDDNGRALRLKNASACSMRSTPPGAHGHGAGDLQFGGTGPRRPVAGVGVGAGRLPD